MPFFQTKNISLAVFFFGLTYILGYHVGQHEFWKIMGCYVPFFAAYIYVATQSPCLPNRQAVPNPQSLKYWLAVAIICRLILVFALPNLSNDIYRFIWDGRLLVQGFNPFDHLPLYYLENNISVEGIDRALFEAYDSKNFFTVYPPVAQAQFGTAVWLFPQNIYGASVVMKLWLFFFEAGSVFLMVKLLKRFNLPTWNVLWYALNPLIIFEICGNLHFEGAMIFFLLLSIWLLTNPKSQVPNPIFLSALAFSLSICSKLLTILFLPFFVRIMGWRKAIMYYVIVGLATVLFFMPIVNATFISNFGDSLNLYFQKLEFNASIYYLVRWAGYHIMGYNPIAVIGPALGLVTMVGILWMAFRHFIFPKYKEGGAKIYSKVLCFSENGIIELWLFSICLYLATTTTMHPWYVAMPLALCVFTKWRFPVVWSGMIFLTYINYSIVPYHENLWIVALEYMVVYAWFIWEWRKLGGLKGNSYFAPNDEPKFIVKTRL